MTHEQTLAEMICEYMREEVPVETRANLTSLRDVLDLIDPVVLDDMKEMIFDSVLRELRFMRIDEILQKEAKEQVQTEEEE